MSIIVDTETKLVISGLTGREGSFHGLRNRDYGTDVVAGVTPGKGGQEVEGIPVFDEIAQAVEERGANTSMIFVPARFAAAAMEEAIAAGVHTVIAITEGIPVLDMLRVYWTASDKFLRAQPITISLDLMFMPSVFMSAISPAASPMPVARPSVEPTSPSSSASVRTERRT